MLINDYWLFGVLFLMSLILLWNPFMVRNKLDSLLLVEAEAVSSPSVAPVGNFPSYSSPAPSAPQWVLCRVCSSFAPSRCGGCKVATYCSGQCQIIDWRQGHRKECRPRATSHQRNHAESLSDQKLTNNPEPTREAVSFDGDDGNSAETIILSDPEVLNCSICYDYLSILVYQCTNGHILCSLCSARVGDFCPTCNSQSKYYRCRAIEKIIESAKAACPNYKYGCTMIIPWIDRCTHEAACLFSPCCCPITNCGFSGTPLKLSAHVRREHEHVIRFSHGQNFRAILSRDVEFRVLLEEKKGTVFVLHNQRQVDGNSFSVSVIAQKNMGERFNYKIKARHGGYTRHIKVPTDIIQRFQVDHTPTHSLVIPNSYFNILDEIKLKLCICTGTGKTSF